jgi:hypothetical protein
MAYFEALVELEKTIKLLMDEDESRGSIALNGFPLPEI